MNNIDQKYFPQFKQSFIDVGEGIKINTYVAGTGKEAILLLHGHPETHLIWRFITTALLEKYTVVITDLRGYGDSTKPQGLPNHENYSKHAMGEDQFEVMTQLGFEKFHLAGHDRGARVAHRMIMERPERIITCIMMDILPTIDMYQTTNQEFATKYYHWFLYIQGNGLPEKLLGADPEFFVNYNLNLKIGPKAREKFPPEILEEYTRCLKDPMTIHGICEDYRASAGIDIEQDKIDMQTPIKVPMLAMWGANGVVGKIWDVYEGWKKYVPVLEGYAVPDCGHFVPEEQPELVVDSMLKFMEKYKEA